MLEEKVSLQKCKFQNVFQQKLSYNYRKKNNKDVNQKESE